MSFSDSKGAKRGGRTATPPLRPSTRTKRVRHRPRRRPARARVAGAARPRARGSRRGRAPRRMGGRRRHRRRRRCPLPAEPDDHGNDGRGRRDVLPPGGVAPLGRRGRVPRGRAPARRVARGSDPDRCPRRHRARVAAPDRPAPARALGAPRRRAARLPRAPAGRAHSRRLRRLALLPHGDVQGPLRGGAARALLSGPRGSRPRGAVRDLPPALLDEHRAELGARPAVPPALPQRRDQHDRRQRHLDGGARAGSRRRAGAGACARPERVGLRAPRQRARAARARRRCRDRPRRCRRSSRPPGRTTRAWTTRFATSTATARCSASRGTDRRRCASRTAGRAARRSTATAFDHFASPSPATSFSPSPPRQGRCRCRTAPPCAGRGWDRAAS